MRYHGRVRLMIRRARPAVSKEGMAMNFEWDDRKRRINLRRHRIELADAVAVFSDPFALTQEDFDHDEQRFVTLGRDALGRLLVVAYTYRESRTIRLISARKAEPHERKQYEG
jgi:hypothetical protein